MEEAIRVRVGRRFTITIPKKIREKLGIKEGDELDLIPTSNGIMIRKPSSLIEFINCIKPIGSIKKFLEERGKEENIEDERIDELAECQGMGSPL